MNVTIAKYDNKKIGIVGGKTLIAHNGEEWQVVAQMGNNVWLPGLFRFERAFMGSSHILMVQGAINEIKNTAKNYPDPHTCEKCSGEGWYKPSVGAYICPNCGAVEVQENVWVKREY